MICRDGRHPELYRLPAGRRLLRAFKMDSWVKMRLDRKLAAIMEEPDLLAKYELSLAAEQIRALAEVVTGSGYHRGSVDLCLLRRRERTRQGRHADQQNEFKGAMHYCKGCPYIFFGKRFWGFLFRF